ncbi:heat stress transcription factor B-4-like protein, partial [Tanacetum coccineum]
MKGCMLWLARGMEPRFRSILEEITDEHVSIAANRTEKMLLLTWYESSETTKEPICESVTPISLPQHDSSTPCKDYVCASITPRCMPDCIITPPTDESVIDDVVRQLSLDETELDGEVGFADVARSGVDSSGLSHDESFGVDDLDLNLNEPVNLNVSQVKTQSKLPVSEEPDVGRTQEPILSEVCTQELIMTKVSTQKPIMAEVSIEIPIVKEVRTQEFSVEDIVVEDYVSSEEDGEDAEHGNGQEDESAPTNRQFFYDDEGIDTNYETKYDVQSSEDAGTDDDDDVDKDFLVDKENEIVEPDVDVHLFGISMDLPFDNICVTDLVTDDVLEGEDADVINLYGFDGDHGNDEETNYRKRRLVELRTEMEGVIKASGQWKYLFYTGQKFNTPKEAKDIVYLRSIKSKRNLKLYKNDSVMIRARCEGKVPIFTMSQGTGPTGPNHGMEAGPSGSSGPATRSKKKEEYRVNPDIPVKEVQDQLQRELEVQISMSKAFRARAKANPNTIVKIAVERNIDPFFPSRVFQRIYICLRALKLGFKACIRDMLGLDGAFMKGSFLGQVLVAVGLDSNNGIYPLAYTLVEAKSKSSWCWFLQCLGDDIDLHPNSNFTFINNRQKGIIPAIKTVYPSAEHRYCLRHIHENMKQGWCGQAYKDLLWRAASATNVRDFEKCMLELKTMNPKAHEWLNKIPAEHWARSHFSGRAKSDLLLNNICEVFNGKIVGGRDKPVITLLEYIREYCMKRIVNVQGVIDKCTGPLTPTTTRIMESIKKEAHLMKVQWNGANKYQVSGSLGDQCVVDVDQVLGEVYMSNNTFATQASCPGSNNAEASGSASRQAQQTEPAVGQDGSGGLGASAVIGLSATDGQGAAGGASGPGGAGVGLSETRNANGREMGDGIPSQSSASGG